jgi:FtsP/CotA-like multicopper oxidase with cupredoxin domain
VAVRCSGEGTVTLAAAGSTSSGRDGGDDLVDGGDFSGPVLTVHVTGADAGAVDLAAFSVNRPCYLADTRSAAAADESGSISLGNSFTINGQQFMGQDHFLQTFTAGHLIEQDVTGMRRHPYHGHVNHFQIVSMTASDPIYFQVREQCVCTRVYACDKFVCSLQAGTPLMIHATVICFFTGWRLA